MTEFFWRKVQSPAWQLAFCILLPLVASVGLYQLKQGRFIRVSGMVQAPVQVDGVLWDVPQIRLDEAHGRYEIAGWVADKKNVAWLRPRVVLVPQYRTDGLEIRTALVVRKDVSDYIADGRELHFSGYKAFVRARDLPHAPGAHVYLSIERGGQRILIDTKTSLPEATHGQPD